jgi:hypothetical protein
VSTLRGWIVPALSAVLAAVLAFGLGQNARWVSGRHWIMDLVTVAGSAALVVGIVAVTLVVGLWLTRRRAGSLAGRVALAVAMGAAAGFVVGSNVGPVYPAGDEYPTGTISLDVATPDGRRLAGPVTCTVAFERERPAGFVTSMRGNPLWGDAGPELVLDVTFDAAGAGADVSVFGLEPWTELYRGRTDTATVAGDPDRRSGTASFTATAVEGGAGSARGSFAWDCRPGAATPQSTPTPVPTAAPPLGGSLTLTGDVAGTFALTAPACDIAANSQLGADEVTGSGTLSDGRPATVSLSNGEGAELPRPLWGINLRLVAGPDADGVVLMSADGNALRATLNEDWSFTLEASGTFEGLGEVEVAGSWRCLEAP